MSETTEPATIKDLVERFRKFSFRLETYPIKRGGNFVYQFDAAEIAPQHRLRLHILRYEAAKPWLSWPISVSPLRKDFISL